VIEIQRNVRAAARKACLAALLLACHAAPAAAQDGADGGGRFPALTRAEMPDAASQAIFDSLAGPNGVAPGGALGVALYSPGIAAALDRMQDYLLEESALGAARVELLGLITAREMNLAYAWSRREPAASRAGVDRETIDAIRNNEPLAAVAGDDRLLVDFGRQLFRNRHVAPATFTALLDRFGRQTAFDAMMALTIPAMTGLLERAADLRPGSSGATLPALAGVGTPPGRIGEFVGLGPRPPLPADVFPESWYRIPLLGRDEFDARGREIFDRLVGADQATTPRGPVGMTMLSPEFAEPVQQINTLLRVEGLLDRRMAEIVIATAGREMNSQYQWTVHGGGARNAGAGEQVLDAIRDDAELGGLDPRDAAAIALVRDLFRESAVRPAIFDESVRQFGLRGTVEIAALAGDYLMMTTVYNALGMRMRDDQAATLPHRAGAPIGAEWR